MVRKAYYLLYFSLMNNIKILDGAIGSELILRGEKLPPYIWSADTNLTNPDLLLDIHRK